MIWTRRLYRYMRALITGKMPDNHTPLQYAASTGNVRSAHTLLQFGVNIDEREEDIPPLHLAVYNANVEVVRLLLEHGADTSGQEIRHALLWAEKTGHIDIAHLLKQAGVDASSSE